MRGGSSRWPARESGDEAREAEQTVVDELAILFWCYKAPSICRERVALLRALNPELPIYVLYGGPAHDRSAMVRSLSIGIDDFLAYDGPEDPRWRWLNGDLMIADWYQQRGRSLRWDTIAVAQWDLLALATFREAFVPLKRNELFVTGLRPMREVEAWWIWVARNVEYQKFLNAVFQRWGRVEPLASQFILAALPRTFLAEFAGSVPRNVGFIEYRLPTLAKVLGFSFGNCPKLECWWNEPNGPKPSPNQLAMSASPESLPLNFIAEQLCHPNGPRFFHPFKNHFDWEDLKRRGCRRRRRHPRLTIAPSSRSFRVRIRLQEPRAKS
jgi:hypothetical protein